MFAGPKERERVEKKARGETDEGNVRKDARWLPVLLLVLRVYITPTCRAYRVCIRENCPERDHLKLCAAAQGGYGARGSRT